MDRLVDSATGHHIFSFLDAYSRYNQIQMHLREREDDQMEGGKFLGFMLTHRGIKANLEKCKAISEMRSPNNIKEV